MAKAKKRSVPKPAKRRKRGKPKPIERSKPVTLKRAKTVRRKPSPAIDLRLSPSVQSICKVIERSTLKPARKRKPRQKPSVAVEAIPSPMIQLLKDDTKRLQQEILILLRGEQPLPPTRRIEVPVEQTPDPAMIDAMNAIRSKLMRGRQTIH